MYRHDGRGAKKTSHLDHVAHRLAFDRDDTDGGCFAVDHTDGRFVGDDGRNRVGRGLTRDGDHVEADRADAGHRL